ncbi:MAG: phenylacetate--CoA ligase family protein [Nanobdellota archaeon]
MIKKLKKIIHYNAENVPFYYEHFKDYSLDLKSIEDFENLPTTSKNKFIDYFGSGDLDFGMNNVYFRSTSGTSNKMAIFYWNDVDDKLNSKRYVEKLEYVSQDDKMHILWPNVGYAIALHYRPVKCAISLGNAYDLKYSAYLLMLSKSNILMTTPPLALKILKLLREEGYKKLEKIIIGGSGLSQLFFRKIREFFPNIQIILTYGLAEAGKVMYQCPELYGTNMYHTYDDYFYYEFLKDSPNAEEGEITITKLWAPSGTPLIRYKTGDMAKTKNNKCTKCGKNIIQITGKREFDNFKLHGITYYKDEVDALLKPFEGKIQGQYQILIEEVEADSIPKAKLIFKIATTLNKERFRKKIEKHLNHEFKVTNDYSWFEGVKMGLFEPIEVVLVDKIDEIKDKRVIDKRFSD